MEVMKSGIFVHIKVTDCWEFSLLYLRAWTQSVLSETILLGLANADMEHQFPSQTKLSSYVKAQIMSSLTAAGTFLKHTSSENKQGFLRISIFIPTENWKPGVYFPMFLRRGFSCDLNFSTKGRSQYF